MTLQELKRWSKPNKNGCWVWQRSKQKGYGAVWCNGMLWRTHRLAFKLAHPKKEIDSLCVLHTCDNKACINPDHLYAGTHADNARDAFARGQQISLKGQDHPKSRFTNDQVKWIRGVSGLIGVRELARKFGVDHSSISRIMNKKSWNHLK